MDVDTGVLQAMQSEERLQAAPSRLIEAVGVSGYRSVPHEELVEVELKPLTVFVGGLDSGKSLVINALRLFSETVMAGRPVGFLPERDSNRGRPIPPLIMYRLPPEVLSRIFSMDELTRLYPATQAVNIMQQLKEIRRKQYFAPTILFEPREEDYEIVAFIDPYRLGIRARGVLRRIVSERAPEALNLSRQLTNVFKHIASLIDYKPVALLDLPEEFRGVPRDDPLNPASTYYWLLLSAYPSEDWFRENLLHYVSRVTPYRSIRLLVGEAEGGRLRLGVQLLDPLLNEWRLLDAAGGAVKAMLPLLISLASATPGSMILADSLGRCLDPGSVERLAAALVDTVAKGVQVVVSTSREDVVYSLAKNSVEKIGEENAVFYAVSRRPGDGAPVFHRFGPRIPVRDADAVKVLESLGFRTITSSP